MLGLSWRKLLRPHGSQGCCLQGRESKTGLSLAVKSRINKKYHWSQGYFCRRVKTLGSYSFLIIFFKCNRAALNSCSSKTIFLQRSNLCLCSVSETGTAHHDSRPADRNSELERDTLEQQSPKTGGTLYWLSLGECLCGYQKLFMARAEAQG